MNASDVNDLLIFTAVADAGSFVAGGRSLGLSRSAAGKAVARLEARFAARLFNRTTRALRLTQAGQELLHHAQAIRAAMDAAERSIGAPGGDPKGVLRLAAPDAFGRRVLLPLAAQFLKQWPDLQLEMSFSDQLTNLVEDGFDLAIRIGVSEPPPGLISRTLLRAPTLLCAAPDYLSRMGTPQNSEQLTRHELLFHASRNERLHWRLEEPDGTVSRAQGRSRMRLDNGEALREAALAGLGITLLPTFLVADDLASGRLLRVLPEVRTSEVPIVALYPHRRHLEPNIRAFIDLLVANLPR